MGHIARCFEQHSTLRLDAGIAAVSNLLWRSNLISLPNTSFAISLLFFTRHIRAVIHTPVQRHWRSDKNVSHNTSRAEVDISFSQSYPFLREKNFSDLALLFLQSAPIPRKGKRSSLNLGDDTNFFAQFECAPLSSIIRRGVQLYAPQAEIPHFQANVERLVQELGLATSEELLPRFQRAEQLARTIFALADDVVEQLAE